MGLRYNVANTVNSRRNNIVILSVLIISVVIFRFAYLFESVFNHIVSTDLYLTWHSIFEFASILVSFAVFVVSYYTYEQTRGVRFIFLGSVFLVTGVIDAFHALSFKGMPVFFIENNSANRATTFWIIARLTASLGFFASSFIPVAKKSAFKKHLIIMVAAAFSLFVLAVTTYYPGAIPAMYIENEGLTHKKILLEYVIIMLLILAIVRYLLEYKRTGDMLATWFCGALALNIFSEFAFLYYVDVYDIYNYIGHVYKFAAYYIIFRIMFIYNVQKPYVELYEAKNTLKDYAENLDRIVDARTMELKEINQKLMDDLEYARDIQRAILPVSLPAEQHVQFCAKYFPADRVSGDFYNVFKLNEDNLGMYIGDVAGHGVPAAMLMVFMNQNLKTIRGINEGNSIMLNPSEVLNRIYHAFNKTNFKEEIYSVILYAVYNIKNRTLTYSSAGMNVYPLVLKASGRVSPLKINGFPICKFMEFHIPEYLDSSIELEIGDKILFYTDGLIETENNLGQSFSQARLISTLENGINLSCNELADIIARDVFDFIGNTPPRDDITYFILEVI